MTDTIPVELVTPERLVFSDQVEMVEVPGVEGDFGVLPGHMNFISVIRPGVVKFHLQGGEIKRSFVVGGVAEVTPDHCTILAEQEVDLSTLTLADVQARLASAKREVEVSGTDEQKQAAGAELALSEALVEALAS